MSSVEYGAGPVGVGSSMLHVKYEVHWVCSC